MGRLAGLSNRLEEGLDLGVVLAAGLGLDPAHDVDGIRPDELDRLRDVPRVRPPASTIGTFERRFATRSQSKLLPVPWIPCQ